MPPDDNDDTEPPALEDTPELKRLLEAFRNFSPKKKRQLLERMGLKSVILPRYPTKPPPEDEEPE
jgi:hypothetical protein